MIGDSTTAPVIITQSAASVTGVAGTGTASCRRDAVGIAAQLQRELAQDLAALRDAPI
ncbi:hypothetical protein [Burkholderia sp. BCC0322]|uniref:hypothetical protein n=1 Tax=unclassified Burkholderia TaxID=2613784 RepID=UPI00158DBB45|nr:hypothetical protein [Burkholderia sp. BCC0322]